MRGAVIRAFYQPPLIRPASSSSNCPNRFQVETGAGRNRRRRDRQSLRFATRNQIAKRRLVTSGAVPIAAAARSAPASIRAADPGACPWATRSRSATGNFFNRGVIGPRRWNGRRPGKSERTSRPKRAERRQRQHCLFASNSSVVCGASMIAVSRHDKKRRTLCPQAKSQGTLACRLRTSGLGIDAPSL
jgi:hypothetical protein